MTATNQPHGVRTISFEALRREIQAVSGRPDSSPDELVEQAKLLLAESMLVSTPEETQGIAERWDAALRRYMPAARTGARNIFGRRRAVRPRIPATMVWPRPFLTGAKPELRMLPLDSHMHVLARGLAEKISRLRSTAFHQDRTPLTVTISENTLEGIEKILEGATSPEEQPGQISAGISHLVRTLPNELGRVQASLGLRADVEQLLADLLRAFPDPAPFTPEATTIDRLRAALVAADGEASTEAER